MLVGCKFTPMGAARENSPSASDPMGTSIFQKHLGLDLNISQTKSSSEKALHKSQDR